MKLTTLICLATTLAFSESAPTIQHATVTTACQGFILDALAAGCGIAHTQITAHPSNAGVVGFLITLTYRDYQGFGPRTITVTTFERNAAGDFVASAPAGQAAISGLELYAGQLAQDTL